MTRVVEEGPYTLTLVAVDNVSGTIADFNSTLEVMVDDIEDETTIACDVFNDRDQLTISKSNTVQNTGAIIHNNTCRSCPISTI